MVTYVFLGALVVLALFLWYLATDNPPRRRNVGLAMWLIAAATCLITFLPPNQLFFAQNADGSKSFRFPGPAAVTETLGRTVQLGLDLKGGTSFTLQLKGTPKEGALQQAVEVIRKRVDGFGLSEPLIQPVGTDRILVQIPGLSETNKIRARETLKQVAKLEFRLVHPNSARLVDEIAGGGPVPVGYQVMPFRETRQGKPVEGQMLVERRSQLGGRQVTRADWTLDPAGQCVILLSFNAEGGKIFADLTAQNVNRELAIILDGVVRSAPNINQAIPGGNATISGQFSVEEAETLASTLQNPLEYPVEIIEERGVDPSLGADSIRSGVIAGLIGAAAVVLFMLVYYRYLGVVAIIALVVNQIILFGLLTQFHFTLTLPGIAGIILSVGMAVDANVLIYERIREEMAAGKTVQTAISAGFEKAFSSIVDANITTVISAIILFWQGSGPVKGFAITLTLGILGTLFAALIVTRNVIERRDARKPIEHLTMMQMFHAPKIDLVKYRWIGVGLSVAVIAVGLGTFFIKKPLSVDFTGGDALVATYSQSQDTAALRSALDKAGFKDFTLQNQKSVDGSSQSLLIRARENDGERILLALQQSFPGSGFEKKGLERVGGVVGEELKQKSVIALVLGLVGIFAYVMVRFEFSFAVGAIVALLHDVLITIGIMALFGREISLTVVGAILAIAGYSINDTIVVFDRVREILRSEIKGSLPELMNLALNLTLSRTFLTAGTTFITTLSLAVFGGPVIFDFALTLLIGIAVGTYSSLFIAAPIVLWFTGGRQEHLRRQVSKPQEAAVVS
jgi:SecD/SecF fusion protein